ncbi:MAG: glycoside hydrolase family 130 protein [Chloroflexota bacterium]|nr:MAG: glycoside hydrolase family 130 protein [Chloroflexota bacterium]
MVETHLLRRYEGNPILTAADFPRPVNSVFNAAVTTYRGQTILLNRVEDLTGSSSLWLARSDDGIHFTPEPEPALLPSAEEPYHMVEHFSLEDPRITQIDDYYYITYAGFSQYDCATVLARTTDFKEFERVAIITVPDNKNVVLFPEMFNGRYARLERPMTRTSQQGNIWVSFSPDLVYWGDPHFLMGPQPRKWDEFKIGPGAPPIRTQEGWLEIYHGVRRTASGALYRLGAVLLDLDEPWRIIGRAPVAILSPVKGEDYMGNVANVVFSCGALLHGDDVKVYYGAADHVMCLATAPVDDIITLCLQSNS